MRSFEEIRLIMLNSSNDQELKEAVQDVVSFKESSTLALLLHLLDNTSSNSVRNAIALALRDLEDPSVVPILMKHISNPENATSNGTMVYALETLDARSATLELINLACKGDYELISMIMNAIEAFKGPVNQTQKQASLDALVICLQGSNHPKWKYDMLSELYTIIDMLDTI